MTNCKYTLLVMQMEESSGNKTVDMAEVYLTERFEKAGNNPQKMAVVGRSMWSTQNGQRVVGRNGGQSIEIGILCCIHEEEVVLHRAVKDNESHVGNLKMIIKNKTIVKFDIAQISKTRTILTKKIIQW